jgi:hypothetical protein
VYPQKTHEIIGVQEIAPHTKYSQVLLSLPPLLSFPKRTLMGVEQSRRLSSAAFCSKQTGSQLTSDQLLVGLNHSRVMMLDGRLAGDKVVESQRCVPNMIQFGRFGCFLRLFCSVLGV